MIKVAIVGPRPPKFDAPAEKRFAFERLLKKVDLFFGSIPADRGDKDVLIVSGGAVGIDTRAEQTAKRCEIPYLVWPARWTRYGKSAGHRRNPIVTVEIADVALAFWDGESSGTGGSVNALKVANKPHMVIYPDSPAPTWNDVLRLAAGIHENRDLSDTLNIG